MTVQKIIHLVLGKANPDRMNGVNRVAHNHAMSLFEMGFDVEIWGITKNLKGEVYPRPFPTRLFKSQPFYRELDPELLYAISQLPDNTVFHIHGAFIADFYKLTSLLIEMKIDYVYTPHGAFNEVALEKSKWIKKIYLHRYERSILKNAKKVQFLGKSEFEHIGRILNLQNRIIIPNGQNPEELQFEFHRMQRRHSPVFGFCGRMDIYYKGLDLLIDGFAEYINAGGAGELWLIGDGPDRAELEGKVAALNLNSRITFMGPRYGREKLNRIANMDLFCHPSRSEGSPTAVLEAAALGKPVLVSTGTNVGELVESKGCGLHITKNTASGIAKGMMEFESLYEKGMHHRMGENAARMVAEEFSWKKIAGQLAEIYDTAC